VSAAHAIFKRLASAIDTLTNDLSIASLRFDLLLHDITKIFCMIQRGLRTFTTLSMTEGSKIYSGTSYECTRRVYSDCVCLKNSFRLHAVSYGSFCCTTIVLQISYQIIPIVIAHSSCRRRNLSESLFSKDGFFQRILNTMKAHWFGYTFLPKGVHYKGTSLFTNQISRGFPSILRKNGFCRSYEECKKTGPSERVSL